METKDRKQVYQLAGIGHWELDLENDDLYWSDEVKRLHEVPLDYQPTLEEAIAFYEEGTHRQHIRSAVDDAIANGESYVVEAKIITAEGNQRWVKTIGEPVFEEEQCVRLHGTTQDITDRKKTEQRTDTAKAR
ncbi:MAG: PAS domain-containing protein [Fodinibius sp.]|nr:PAS domain-containing protein [Fodinibius sp.]